MHFLWWDNDFILLGGRDTEVSLQEMGKKIRKSLKEKCVTPAMACGISFVQFSLYEILTFSPTLD